MSNTRTIVFDPVDRPALVSHLQGQPAYDERLTKLEVEAEGVILGNIDQQKTMVTKNGERLLLTFNPPVPDALSNLYRSRKEDCKAVGISWKKDDETGEWSMTWWHRIPLHDTELAEFEAEEVREKLHRQLKSLAFLCDGANAKDGMGFNALDTGIGHELASRDELTPKQARLADRILHKYQSQFKNIEDQSKEMALAE